MTTDIHALLTEARERLTVSRLGGSSWREMDADLIMIRRLINALKAEHKRAETAEATGRRILADSLALCADLEWERDVAEAQADSLRAAIEEALGDIRFELRHTTPDDEALANIASITSRALTTEPAHEHVWESYKVLNLGKSERCSSCGVQRLRTTEGKAS